MAAEWSVPTERCELLYSWPTSDLLDYDGTHIACVTLISRAGREAAHLEPIQLGAGWAQHASPSRPSLAPFPA